MSPRSGETDTGMCRTAHGSGRPHSPCPVLTDSSRGQETPVAPPGPAVTPNLHQKSRWVTVREQVTSPLPPPRPPTASQPPDGPRCPARTEARRNREIRTYGFIYQSAAAGHTAMELPAPPPSRPPRGGALGGARLPAIGPSGCRSDSAGQSAHS